MVILALHGPLQTIDMFCLTCTFVFLPKLKINQTAKYESFFLSLSVAKCVNSFAADDAELLLSYYVTLTATVMSIIFSADA